MLPLLVTALLLLQSLKDVNSSPVREAREAFKEGWLTRALRYMKSNPETLEELMSKDHAVSEGDVMLSSDRNAVENAWPTRAIPYVISPELVDRTNDILSAMAMVSEHTCVSFHNRTSETNYLLYKKSKGCASYVGFIGGEQPVFVGPPCIVGNIIHEILHALGFHHEHTRADREQYVTIFPHNIMKGMERNFKKQTGQTFNLSYDITSIMHYGSGFFSINGLPTITPNDDVKDMGQRVKMTKLDIERVRHLYICDLREAEAQPGGSGAKREQDSNRRVLVHSVVSALQSFNRDHVPASKPEEDHTSTTAPPSTSPQHLTAATRGNQNSLKEAA